MFSATGASASRRTRPWSTPTASSTRRTSPAQAFAITGLANSANLVAFYDKHGFQVRVAGNWRGSYLLALGQSQGGTFGAEPVYVDKQTADRRVGKLRRQQPHHGLRRGHQPQEFQLQHAWPLHRISCWTSTPTDAATRAGVRLPLLAAPSPCGGDVQAVGRSPAFSFLSDRMLMRRVSNIVNRWAVGTGRMADRGGDCRRSTGAGLPEQPSRSRWSNRPTFRSSASARAPGRPCARRWRRSASRKPICSAIATPPSSRAPSFARWTTGADG